MHFYPTERIALFIDGANLYATAKALGFDIDYKRLLALFRTKGQLVRALYYTALAEDQEYSSIRPLVDWLDYNGYMMVTKPTKEFTDSFGRRKIKGNMDIELTVDAMRLAENLDHVVLFTGDGDFRALVAALQQSGRRVSVISTLQTQPPMVADELRRQADQFIDLADLEDQICRDPASRPVREPREPGQRPVGRRPRGGTRRLDAGLSRRRGRRPRLTPLRAPLTRSGNRDATAMEQAGRSAARLPALPAARRLPLGQPSAASPLGINGAVAFVRPGERPHARLLIVGLAPGLKGANRTGRPFTGDFAGDLLYETLLGFGFARGRYEARPDDGLGLVDCMITNAVRCVPPENKPTPAEIATCRPFLAAAHRRPAAPRRHRGARAHRPRQHAGGARRAQGELPVRARRAPRGEARPDAVRQLPLLALQHQHRQADARDVSRRVRAPCGSTCAQ